MENNENTTLATELLHELKASAKRWFIIAVIELFIILGIISGFVWYLSLPVEEYYSIEQDSDNSSTNNVIGGNYNGSEAEGNFIQEESK